MNTLEARIIVEDSGNYDEEDMDYIMDIYTELMKNNGFEDNRTDNRFIMKFHDIFYYEPDIENDEEATDIFNALFDAFCGDEYELIIEDLNTQNIDIDTMLHPRYVGHYQGFVVDIPEITENNAVDLAMKIYDEYGYEGKYYVGNYIYTVKLLQSLEDNYMEHWIEFLKDNEYPEKYIKEIEDKYTADQERRK